MITERTLEERRDEIRTLLAAQRQTHARDKVAEAIAVGLLRADFIAEGRPAREFVVWTCGDTYQHVSKPALYDRLACDAAIAAGITTAADGEAPVFSHLVAAGRRLQRGLTPAQVQAEVDAGNVSIRAAKPDTAGLTAIYLPDTYLPKIAVARELTQMIHAEAGQPLPDNAPEITAAMLDLLLDCGYDVLLLALRRRLGTAETFVAERFAQASPSRTVTLTSWPQDLDADALEPLDVPWDADYCALLDAERPDWHVASVTENGADRGQLQRVYP